MEDEDAGQPVGLPDDDTDAQEQANKQTASALATDGSGALVIKTSDFSSIPDLSLIRTEEGRIEYLSAFARAMTPDRIDPKLWVRWLSGGRGPYEGSVPKRPVTHGQSLSRDLNRQSNTVRAAEYSVEKAEQSLKRAQERVELAEAELVKARADDQATLQSAVYETLRSEMEPMFALGPAWAFMRALSGTVPPEEMVDELRFERNEQKRSELEARVRKERRAETKHIMAVLYAWIGDYAFERHLRDAILQVIKDYEKLPAPRSSQDMQSFKRAGIVPGEATADRDDVLNGFS